MNTTGITNLAGFGRPTTNANQATVADTNAVEAVKF